MTVRTVGRILLYLELFMVIAGLLFLAKSCMGLYYSEMTHLSDEDLSWGQCVTMYPNPRFTSNAGDTAELSYQSLEIDNTTNPFYIRFSIDNPPHGNYIADLLYTYRVVSLQDTLKGFLKLSAVQSDTLEAAAGLYVSNLREDIYTTYCYYRPVVTESIEIGGIWYRDCLIFDSINSDYLKHFDDEGVMRQIIISRSYGLVSYSYKDGTIYTRLADTQRQPRFLNTPY